MASIRLSVPFETQNDNKSGQGYRECFSSSCAMLARFWGRVKSDDEYNRLRQRFGDSTSAAAQVQTLRYLGLRSHFWTNGTRIDLERELLAGRPVAVGWLHKGHVSHPIGGGHWSVAVGFDLERVLMHDPYGEAMLITGGHRIGTSASYLPYSWRNWLARWEADGARSGWYVTCLG